MYCLELAFYRETEDGGDRFWISWVRHAFVFDGRLFLGLLICFEHIK